MKSFLDAFHEVSLISVIEDQDGLRCQVMPMTASANGKVIEAPKQPPITIDFGTVAGYLVVPEIIQIGMRLKTLDDSVITEAEPGELMKHLGFEEFLQANRYIVLRTSHQYVNIFIETSEDLNAVVKITAAKAA